MNHASRTQSIPSTELLTEYLRAQLAPADKATEACETFKKLSQETQFPLKNLALLRQYLTCPSVHHLPAPPRDLLIQEPWLSPLFFPAQLRFAEQMGLNERIIYALFDSAQLEEIAGKRVQLLQRAGTLAKNNKLPLLVLEAQQKLVQFAPRFLQNPQASDFLRVGLDFQADRQFVKARKYFLKSHKHSELDLETRYQALRAWRQSFKVQQLKREHIKACSRLTQWVLRNNNLPQRTARLQEAYVTWARAVWTEGQPEGARKLLSRLKKELGNKANLQEIEWILGRMAEEPGDFETALNHYQLANCSSPACPSGSSLSRKILFAKAWSERKLTRWADAAKTLSGLLEQTQDPPERYKALYWLARTQKDLGLLTQSQETYTGLMNEDTLGFYGVLALRDTNRSLPQLSWPKNSPAIERHASVNEAQHFYLGQLTQAEEPEVAQNYLDHLQKSLKIEEKTDPQLWLYLNKHYAKAKLYLPLFAGLSSLSPEKRAWLLATHSPLIFPLDYRELITAWAERLKIPPALALSIIRQESAFNRLARSSADALGLMQLLPSVAKKYSQETKVKFDHHEELFNPEVNIPLGVAHLRDLLDRNNKQFVATVAAYNASEKAFAGWLRTRFRGDPIEFIEDIPYEETRAYIKLVLRNFVFYEGLLSESSTRKFPDWALAGLTSLTSRR